jgi:hypothetical protein
VVDVLPQEVVLCVDVEELEELEVEVVEEEELVEVEVWELVELEEDEEVEVCVDEAVPVEDEVVDLELELPLPEFDERKT